MNGASIKINGHEYGGWTKVAVNLSMDEAGGKFSFSAADPGDLDINEYDACQVYLDGNLVITGIVDRVEVSHDEGNHTVAVSGRDNTAQLADCCHEGPPHQWRNMLASEVSGEICKPFGIPVFVEAQEVEEESEGTSAFKLTSVNPGDKVIDTIAKLARQRGLMPISYGDGKLTLTRADVAGLSGGALVYGRNIKRGHVVRDGSERYSQYIVRGQNNLLDLFSGEGDELPKGPGKDATPEDLDAYVESSLGPRGQATDKGVKPHRPLVILAETKGDAALLQRRAQWEASHRAGKSLSATYTVVGWGPPAGKIWRINTLVPVRDPKAKLNAQLLIKSLAFGQDDSGGTLTTLGLCSPDAYKVMPQADVSSNLQQLFYGGA